MKSITSVAPGYTMLSLGRRTSTRPEISMDDFTVELGYTPNNLRYLMVKHSLTYDDISKIIGIQRNSVMRYATNKKQSTMPTTLWFLLLKHLGYSEQFPVTQA